MTNITHCCGNLVTSIGQKVGGVYESYQHNTLQGVVLVKRLGGGGEGHVLHGPIGSHVTKPVLHYATIITVTLP